MQDASMKQAITGSQTDPAEKMLKLIRGSLGARDTAITAVRTKQHEIVLQVGEKQGVNPLRVATITLKGETSYDLTLHSEAPERYIKTVMSIEPFKFLPI